MRYVSEKYEQQLSSLAELLVIGRDVLRNEVHLSLVPEVQVENEVPALELVTNKEVW
jgi:hypothetical protein